jgi:type II secretory pathway component PulF
MRAAGGRRGSRIPTFARLLYAGRMANFAELLALLVDQQIPLPEAVTLAADASGDAALRRAGEQLAQRIRSGEPPTPARPAPADFPPLIGWLLTVPGQQGRLGDALRKIARAHRSRARRLANWLGVYFPILFTVVIGGAATVFLGASLLGPWFVLLYHLGQSF